MNLNKFIRPLFLSFLIFSSVSCGSGNNEKSTTSSNNPQSLTLNATVGPINQDKIIPISDNVAIVGNQILIVFPDGTDAATVQSVISAVKGKIVGFLSSPDTYQVELPVLSIEELESAIMTLENDQRVRMVMKHHIFKLKNHYDIHTLESTRPDKAWSYKKIEIQRAWDTIKNSNISLSPVKIAIIDSGLDFNHNEFKDVEKYGVNAVSQDGDISQWQDLHGHGTAVAGIIGAHNGEGDMNGILAGLPDSYHTLQIYRAGCGGPSECLSEMAINASIKAAVINGAKVINMSFGDYFDPQQFENNNYYKDWMTRIEYIKFIVKDPRSQNVLFVASAGNDGVDATYHYPSTLSELSNVISVAASDEDDERSVWNSTSSSNFGTNTSVTLAAPGSHVWAPKASIVKENPCGDIVGNYRDFCGTSAAAPIVTGVTALLLQIDPSLTPYDIKNILVETADPIPHFDSDGDGSIENEGSTDVDGDGVIRNNGEDNPIMKRINAKKAVDYVISRLSSAKPTITSSLILLQNPPYTVGQTLTAQFSITNQERAPVTFDVLTIGGRLNNDDTCNNITPKPNTQTPCADFTWQPNITLNPDESFQYVGTLIPQQAGNYHFFTSYQTSDGKWYGDWNIPVAPIVTNYKDITVEESTNSLSITTISLPSGAIGVTYASNLSASGGKTPYNWSVTSGNLPSGLSLDTSGLISGTPTTEGDYIFTVQVKDSSSPQQIITKNLSIKITTSNLPAPTGLTATPKCDSSTPGIELQWNAMSGATKYEIYRNGSLIYTTLTSTPYFWNIIGLIAGQNYEYKLKAKNDTEAASDFSSPVTAIAPTCGESSTTLSTPSANINSSIQVTIQAPFSGDSNTNSSTSFERSTSSAGPWTSVCLSVTGSSPRKCINSGLTPNTNYYFKITFNDPDSVIGTNPQIIGPYTTTSSDTTPPVRSNGSPSGTLSAGTTSTTLSLTTNENTICRYSTTSGINYSSMTNTFSTTGTTSHSQTITGLTNETTYNYYIRCQDTAGNANTDDYKISFSVASRDITPPLRSNGSPTGILLSGTTSTTLSLTTDENATCKYSTTSGTSYVSMTNTFSATGSTNHSGNISGLTNGSSYKYYVRCQDTSNNANSDDFIISFSVASSAPGDLTPPLISNGSPTGTLSSDTTQTTLSLTTDENATCRYSLTAGTAYSAMTNTFSTTGGNNHSTNISNLINGKSYNYYIRCQDVFGNANTNDYTISFSVASVALSLAINSATPTPNTISPGGTFTIDYNVSNSGSSASVILGASIGPAGTNIWPISDTINDKKVSISSGTSNASRQFTVPSNTSPGSYDLLVALWQDVNNNNAIDLGIDTIISSKPVSSAITVNNSAKERITNGNFSSGTTGWIIDPAYPDFWVGYGSYSRSGAGWYAAGVTNNSDGSWKDNAWGQMYQDVDIPSNATTATLSFWIDIATNETTTVANDILGVWIYGFSSNQWTILAAYSNVNNTGTPTSANYQQKSFDLSSYKGQKVRILFQAKENGNNLRTVFRIDDVSLMADGN